MMVLGMLMIFALEFDDIHTFANADQVRTTHLALDLTLDFEKKIIHGHCDLTLAYSDAATDHVDLDSDGLTIASVTNLATGETLPHEIGPHQADKGSRLRIHFGKGMPEKIRIAYHTDPKAEAVQWLDPVQTSSKKHPFLFTQGQSIFTRTWIPCMDSPGVRVTYDAVIRIPAAISAVMSAEHGNHEKDKGIYRFSMKLPIPPYLIALAAGELSFKAISERTGVYAEPAVLEKAAWEFADMEKMVQAAEKLYGAYRWKRWDAIVLPPSFPFGGMENPMLTFATPTLIAGDRSLVGTMAHELAHSWSGNLVTNATWSEFWLNEGYTTYIEKRLTEALYGREVAKMAILLGQQDLRKLIADYGPGSKDTVLHVDLKGRHPDEGFTEIPYEKGSNLLILLENHFGRATFDAYLRQYFDEHAFKSITTAGALAHMKKHLFKGDKALWNKLQVEKWVYQPGLPDNMVVPVSDKFEKTRKAAKGFAGSGDLSGVNKDWITAEWLDFLNNLPDQIERDHLEKIDAKHGLSKSGNSEILFAWLMIAIRNNYEPAYPALEDFLTRMGRRKFLKPLYEATQENPKTRAMGRDIYRRARSSYHPISITTIDEIVKL